MNYEPRSSTVIKAIAGVIVDIEDAIDAAWNDDFDAIPAHLAVAVAEVVVRSARDEGDSLPADLFDWCADHGAIPLNVSAIEDGRFVRRGWDD